MNAELHHANAAHGGGLPPGWTDLVWFSAFAILYLAAVLASNRRRRTWPVHRICSWCAGVACAASAVAGPLAERAHGDFAAHMTAHLLLGMLAPLLIVWSAPVTLLLRTVPVAAARRISRLMHGRYLRSLLHPAMAAFLNVGGLWAIYTTGIIADMHESRLVYAAVHFHLFLAGYLYTAAIINVDPTPHRYSFVYRACVLVAATAGHAVLSKWLYASPPEGVTAGEAQAGALIMYYGGDAVGLLLIAVFCLHWYKAGFPVALRSDKMGSSGRATVKTRSGGVRRDAGTDN